MLRGRMVPLSNGDRGIFQTIRTMRDYVSQFKTDPVIRGAAIAAVFHAPEKSDVSECENLFLYVRDNIRYVRDVYGVETLALPVITLHTRQGDCDDKACLLAAMYEAIGYATRFVVTGYTDPRVFEHVYLQVFCCNKWFNADPTENEPFDWAPPNPVKIYFERV